MFSKTFPENACFFLIIWNILLLKMCQTRSIQKLNTWNNQSNSTTDYSWLLAILRNHMAWIFPNFSCGACRLSVRAAGSSGWWMTMGKWKLCVRRSAAVDHPAAFRWHASSKKNRPSWCLFPFRMATVLPLRTAWIADILSQASLRDVQRQRCWKRGSGDGQRLSLWDNVRHDWAIFRCRWQARFDAHLNRLQGHRRQPIARSGKFVMITACLFAESVGMCLCFLPSCAISKTTLLETW